MPSLVAALVLLALGQASPAPQPGPAPPPPPIPTLRSAEPLRWASVAEAAAGWPGLRVAYARGAGQRLDLGAFADLDASTTELRAGGTLRIPGVVPPVPPFAGALRLSLAWYRDLGGRRVYRHNHADRGVELVPGASWSRAGSRGEILSLLLDLPVVVTFHRDGGVLVRPRAALAYQMPLWGPVTAGVELGLGFRAGLGDAPLKRGNGEVSLLALGGWVFP
jgi:hypothetical protein